MRPADEEMEECERMREGKWVARRDALTSCSRPLATPFV